MGTVSNLITGTTNTFLGDIGTWATYGAAGHTLIPSREQILYANLGSMKVTAASTGPVQMTHTRVQVGDQYDWLSRGFVWVYSVEPFTATAGIVVYNTETESASVTVNVRARKWTLVTVPGPFPESGARVQLHLRFDDLPTGESIYVTNPTLLTPDAISRNVFDAESWLRLPQYLQEIDEYQENPNFPLLRFMDILTASQNDIYNLWLDLRYIPPDDEGGEKISSLDPSIADIATLRWLAQLLGVRFYDPSSGTTSWLNLEEGLDLDGDGAEWSEWESVPDTDDVGSDVSWAEIENFNPSVTGLLELMRWQIQTAYYGLRGGTLEAVVESVKKVLTDTKYVNVVHELSLLDSPQVSGNIGASTPANAAHDLPSGGDFTIVTWAMADDWSDTNPRGRIVAKDDSVSGFTFGTNSSASPFLILFSGGVARSMISSDPGFVNGQGYWLKVVYNATARTGSFYYSADEHWTDPDNVNWTFISTPAAHAAGALGSATSQPLTIGSNAYADTGRFWGSIGRVLLYQGAALVTDVNLFHVAPGATSFIDGGGYTWTVKANSSIVATTLTPDPWSIVVQTLQSETPDEPDIGDSSQTVIDISANAIPAGFEFIHETIAG